MSLWKKPVDAAQRMQKQSPLRARPNITEVTPTAAIFGGEVTVRGSGFTENGHLRPEVRIGDRPASLLMSSAGRLVVRVPEDAARGGLTVASASGVSAPVALAVGNTIAENVHAVANPVSDSASNIFTTLSGSRGQKMPVSVFKITPSRSVSNFLTDLVNPTGLAIDRDGLLYVSSRLEGTVYQVTPEGRRTVYAEGMGIATGIAFDREGNLYVGDRSGTVFKISRDRQIFVSRRSNPASPPTTWRSDRTAGST